jgi:anti-sigma factor (TIGR02949 family)
MSTTMGDLDDIDCIELVERVTEYLDGAMTATDRARFEHHVHECPGCEEILEQLRAVIALTGALQRADAAAIEPARREELLGLFRQARGNGAAG